MNPLTRNHQVLLARIQALTRALTDMTELKTFLELR